MRPPAAPFKQTLNLYILSSVYLFYAAKTNEISNYSQIHHVISKKFSQHQFTFTIILLKYLCSWKKVFNLKVFIKRYFIVIHQKCSNQLLKLMLQNGVLPSAVRYQSMTLSLVKINHHE